MCYHIAMIADMIPFAQTFEAGMLLCFGFSWPIAIVKTWRTRHTEGKSLAFLALIFTGYLLGVLAKILRATASGASLEWVTALYVLNAFFVGVDIALYLRFSPRNQITPGRQDQTDA